jgi:hypothetical protein
MDKIVTPFKFILYYYEVLKGVLDYSTMKSCFPTVLIDSQDRCEVGVFFFYIFKKSGMDNLFF